MICSVVYRHTFGDSTDILVETSNDCNVTGTRFGWDTGMRDAPGALLFNDLAKEWCPCRQFFCLGIWVKLIEFVCAKTVGY